MTIEEYIKYAEGVAEKMFDNAVYIMDKMKSDVALSRAEECRKCAENYRQLAEWLKDYKRLREHIRWMKDWTKCSDNLPDMDVDKIRAEIMDTGAYEQEVNGKTEFLKGINYCLSVIDKYKTESEE